MKAVVIAIGNEVLSGKIDNSNATAISWALEERGYDVVRHMVLPDTAEELKEGVGQALSVAPLVVVCGGLGPTCDDKTRSTLSEFAGTTLEVNAAREKQLLDRFGPIPTLQDQSLQPKGALLIDNPVGTAAAFTLKVSGKLLAALPGVPQEMYATLGPLLDSCVEQQPPSIPKAVFGAVLTLQKEASVDPLLRDFVGRHPEVKVGIYPQQGHVHVRIQTPEEKRALAEELFERLEGQFPHNYFESLKGNLAELIQKKMIAKGKTLALAESCTGGFISSQLTEIPGASQYLLGSIVSYSNSSKQSFLSVPSELIEEKGAVSPEVAKAMCEGAMQAFDSDFAVAVTGIAGPDGGSEAKPVGTVYGAIVEKGEQAVVYPYELKGLRKGIIDSATSHILAQLLVRVAHG